MPVVAAYAGMPEMLERVTDVVRVTQNNSMTVAYACAAARVLEQIILGASGPEAVRTTAAALQANGSGGGSAAQISEELEETAELASGLAFLDGVIKFCGGRYNPCMHNATNAIAWLHLQ